MTQEALQTDLLGALDVVALERVGRGAFALLNEPPPWFLALYPDALAMGDVLPIGERSDFLKDFLTDAEEHWRRHLSGRYKSGAWVATDAAGRDHQLEAIAVSVGERKYLLIEPLRLSYREVENLAQRAREKSLDYERLVEVEKALRESEQRYRDLVENSLGLICTHDLDGNLLMVNPAAAFSLGYRAEDVLGRNLAEFLVPGVRRFFPLYLERIRSARTDSGLMVLLTIDGKERIWQYHNRLEDGVGGAPYVLGHAQDVTVQQQTEEILRQSEERLRLAQEAANMGSWDYDLLTGKLTWSGHQYELYGLPPHVEPADGLRQVIYPGDLERLREAVRRTVEEGARYEVEYRITRPDGALRWMTTQGSLTYNKSGEAVRLIGIVQDITERKQAEETLRESEERYRDLFENANDLIQSVAIDGSFLYVNRAWRNALGYTKEEVERLNVFDIVHPDSLAHCQELFERVMAGERLANVEAMFRTKDGRTLLVEGNVNCRFKLGKPIATRAIFRDITERKQLERDLIDAREAAISASQAKSKFLANMSHEIRTPMNGVIGMTELLLKSELTAEQRKMAETVEFSANALLTVINDVLDFSKIEAGKLILETIDFNLRGVVESVVELLAGEAQKKQIELALLIHNDVPERLRGDPMRLRQVLTNLIGNAIKFTDAGEVVVGVAREMASNHQVTLRFEVRDTGIGMDEATRQHLFQSFSQADASTTRRYGGTGLGLAISKQLVELMGGEIMVESAPAGGSTFMFTALFERQEAKTAALRMPRTTVREARLLVVDDNATSRTILGHYIESWGMRYDHVESAGEALTLLREAAADGAPYDIALLDMQMPETDGLMLAEQIKEDPLIAATRIVMMTSLGNREAEATQGGNGKVTIEAYLDKPVRQSELFDCLAAVIPRNTSERAAYQSAADADAEGDAATRSSRKPRNTARILLAEDSAVNREVALLQLRSMGYAVDTVANGVEVLDALNRQPYPVVLMDCQMPKMDGYEATAEIRRREGGERRTRIIALTANALQGDREKCFAAGMDDYLGKPIKYDELEAMLDKWTAEAPPPEADANDDEPPGEALDAAILGKFRALLGARAQEVIGNLADIFVTDSGTRLQTLRQALAAGAAEEVRKVAHALKGSCANVGARRLAGLCEILEDRGRNGNLEGATGILEQLEAEFTRVAEALDAERTK